MLSEQSYAVSYIVENNPVAVSERLREFGFSVNTPSDIFGALNALLEEGKVVDYWQALNVPMLTAGIDPAQCAVVIEVGQAMAQMANPNGELAKAGVFDPSIFDPTGAYANTAVDGGAVPDGGSNHAPGTGFANVFGAIMSGFVSLMGAGNAANTTVTETSTSAEAARIAADEAARKQRTNRTILIGIGVVVLLVVGYLVYKAAK